MMCALMAWVALQAPVGWEEFGPGSWAEHVTTGKRDGTPIRIVEKSVLKEATMKDIVVSLDTVDDTGGRSAVDMRYPLPQRESKGDDWRKTGEEKLTIDGKEFACDILERRGVRRWVSDSSTANRGVLKSEAISGSVSVILRVLKLDEKITVGKDAVSCWVREEVTDTGDQKTTRKSWMSDEVPGGLVRSEVRQVRGAGIAVETVTTLKAFLVVKKK
jgi:hypothetical protein